VNERSRPATNGPAKESLAATDTSVTPDVKSMTAEQRKTLAIWQAAMARCGLPQVITLVRQGKCPYCWRRHSLLWPDGFVLPLRKPERCVKAASEVSQ
jgi:hypothetical protein